jgi:hypothetical protein
MMTLDDTGIVLKKAAAFDQRTIGAGDVLAWHEIINHLDLSDCLLAVGNHYRDQRDRVMPADIRKLATVIRDAREARQRQADSRAAIAPGTADRSADVKALVTSVAAKLPQMGIHQRAVARARRERGRPATPPPVKARSTKPMKYPPPADASIAALATRYLLDGHDPQAVADRLAISPRWCRKTIARFTTTREEAHA